MSAVILLADLAPPIRSTWCSTGKPTLRRRDDGVEPMLLLLAWPASSASVRDTPSTVSEQVSDCDEVNVVLLVLSIGTIRPGPCSLVKEEVRRCEVEDKQLVFLCNKTADVRATDPEAAGPDKEHRERH
ncbi:hypothetical protein H4582DRAFT_2082664 [Lactarius indigo]|nr:hypothetical protein H4582DRAFT_2082664 [Lactarius indigo]